MSMKIIDKSYFCPHTLEFFFNLTKSNKTFFLFIYPFESIYCRVNRTMLICCGNGQNLIAKNRNSQDCQNLTVKNRNSQVSCFQRYFPEKESKLDSEEAHL